MSRFALQMFLVVVHGLLPQFLHVAVAAEFIAGQGNFRTGGNAPLAAAFPSSLAESAAFVARVFAFLKGGVAGVQRAVRLFASGNADIDNLEGGDYGMFNGGVAVTSPKRSQERP